LSVEETRPTTAATSQNWTLDPKPKPLWMLFDEARWVVRDIITRSKGFLATMACRRLAELIW
jgi:hypothetical protein